MICCCDGAGMDGRAAGRESRSTVAYGESSWYCWSSLGGARGGLGREVENTIRDRGSTPVLKSVLVSRPEILGLLGPPKKRLNFNLCNKRQKCVFCVFSIVFKGIFN